MAGSATYRFSTPVVFKPGTSYLKLVNANQNGSAGVHYRGQLRVVHFTAGLMVVNVLPLESYLYGVVPFESPASWPATALRVQAVAARSYALATRKTGAFDVYCTTASQYYGGLDAGHGEEPSTTKAVKDTAGVVATYGGKPIVAYYFSTSGGHTENIENVWGSAAPVPYLKGVTDPYDGASPYHVWDARHGERRLGRVQAGHLLARQPERRRRPSQDHLRDQERDLAAGHHRLRRRRRRHPPHLRRVAAREPRAARHLGLLPQHVDLALAGHAQGGRVRQPAPPSRGGPTRR